MPVATPEIYRQMLAKAKAEKYAFPAVNVTSMETARACLEGFSRARADGIIQVSTGGGAYASGLSLKDMALGAIAIAEYVHLLAQRFDIYVALHTDHCQPSKLDTFVRPLIEETKRRRSQGQPNLFNGHMFDGSELPIEDNMNIARQLLGELRDTGIILEAEIGVVGGEEDDVDTSGAPAEKLYTSPEDMIYAHKQLSELTDKYLLAATFGNVHGIYQPGKVQLRPDILKQGQEAVAKEFPGHSLDLVFHGGSGSSWEEIRETLEYGVIKMNVDTQNQFNYSLPIADHMFTNYKGVLALDGVGNKKVFDPRSYGKKAEEAMAAGIANDACQALRCAGKTLVDAK